MEIYTAAVNILANLHVRLLPQILWKTINFSQTISNCLGNVFPLVTFHFSPNRPTGPIRFSSCDFCPCLCCRLKQVFFSVCESSLAFVPKAG